MQAKTFLVFAKDFSEFAKAKTFLSFVKDFSEFAKGIYETCNFSGNHSTLSRSEIWVGIFN